MKIWNGIDTMPDPAGPVVATIGNFDGVHLGHRAILQRVVSRARSRGERSLLITFSPHPLAVLAPERCPKLLQTRGQKLESLRQTGLSDVLILEFHRDLANLDGKAFFAHLLADHLTFSAVCVGQEFRFGHERRGDLALLRGIGEANGFEVEGLAPITRAGQTVSSSAIREALDVGDVESAMGMLGRPFTIVGEVVHGSGRGKSLSCPTANLEIENEVIPGRGVYVTEAHVLATRLPSLTNVGVRPTFGGHSPTIETHLLEFDEDLYHERMSVGFLARLRDEQHFPSVADLADQLARDRAAAEGFFQNLPLRAQ